MKNVNPALFAAAMGLALAAANGQVRAECSADNWRECEDKPWGTEAVPGEDPNGVFCAGRADCHRLTEIKKRPGGVRVTIC